MGKVQIAFACVPYDRVMAIMNGSIVPDGIDLNFMPLQAEEIFWRQLRHTEFDVSEVSLSSYIMARSGGDDRLIAIPVFTSRSFRHASIYINANKGINTPQDLRGKIIGVPEYQITAALWLRGLFQHEYGLHPREIIWRRAGVETPGRVEKVTLKLPEDIDYAPAPAGKSLSGMLETGEIDAMFTGRAPSCFDRRSPNVKRLFEDYLQVEKEYFQKTGLFPIMHTICIKREIYNKYPWVAMSLFKALKQAKDQALENLQNAVVLYSSLPWLLYEAERTREIMGEDWWPYGIEPNRKTVETMCQYSYEQGLSKKLMSVEDLFAPETFDEFKV